MEEAQYKIMRIREGLEYLLLKKPAAELRFEDVDHSSTAYRKSVPARAGAGWNTGAAARPFAHQLKLVRSRPREWCMG